MLLQIISGGGIAVSIALLIQTWRLGRAQADIEAQRALAKALMERGRDLAEQVREVGADALQKLQRLDAIIQEKNEALKQKDLLFHDLATRYPNLLGGLFNELGRGVRAESAAERFESAKTTATVPFGPASTTPVLRRRKPGDGP